MRSTGAQHLVQNFQHFRIVVCVMHGKLTVLRIERRLHALGIARLQAWHIHHGYHNRITHDALLGFVTEQGANSRIGSSVSQA